MAQLLIHTFYYFTTITLIFTCYMFSLILKDSEKGISKKERKNHRRVRYYKCERCGYISIVKDSFCPICAKDGKVIKMKSV